MQALSVGSATTPEGRLQQGNQTSDSRSRRRPHSLHRLLGGVAELRLHGRHSLQRAELQAYIAMCFQRAYQAEVSEFAPLLLELSCAGSISGVAGLRPAASEPLFLEQYLDVPVEQVASRVAGQPVNRDEIVELCNLAALRPGACQLINIMLAAVLHAAGYRYASLAGTAQLERILCKQSFALIPVASADPARLGVAAAQWGSYYAASPKVLLVDLAQTMQAINTQRLASAVCEHFADTIICLSNSLTEWNRQVMTTDTAE
jgi:hypothetical protein